MNNSHDTFRLNANERTELAITLSQLERFPRALLALARFPISDLEVALTQDEPISCEQLLAGAYFGFAPLPATYRKLYGVAEHLNRHRDDKAEANMLAGDDNASARESEVARELGYADRRSIKRLYHELDELAETHGFESFDAIINWAPAITECAVISSPEERKAFATGPVFLYDLAKKARGAKLSDLAFSARDGWALIAHRESNVVSLHAINPIELWHKGFVQREVINISLSSFKGWPPIMPDAVYDALIELAASRYPECEIDLVLPESNSLIHLDMEG